MGLGRVMMGVPLLACLLSTVLATNTADEVVKVSTIPIFPHIPRGQTSKDFQVLVRVEAPPAAEKGRVPINLVTVLDVGANMRSNLVNKTIKFINTQLDHVDDRLTIVWPSNSEFLKEHNTDFLDIRDGRRIAQKKVDEFEVLEESAKILDGQQASSNGSASFIILVTDREDSRRFNKSPAALKNHPVHTFGFGASHDPTALLSIANESRGTYSFVDHQNQDKITGALAVCLGGLKTVVAVRTLVSLKAAEGNGVKIEKIESGGYVSLISDDKAAGEVTIGVLYSREVKSFIVHLHVPAPKSVEDGCDQQQLLTASFHHGNTPPIQAVLSVQRPAPQAAAVLQKAPLPMVVNRIVQFSVLEMVTNFVHNEILNPVKEGNVLGNTLQSQWDQFVHDHQFWSGLDLGGLESEINVMVSTLQQWQPSGGSSSSFSEVAYIFSWLSSYQTQRPTAMGSPDKFVATFITLDVQITLQQVEIKCNGDCVEPLPPMLQPSGRGDNTYHLNAAYQDSVGAINQAMNQMYLAIVKASNLRRCPSSKEPRPSDNPTELKEGYLWDDYSYNDLEALDQENIAYDPNISAGGWDD